MPNEPLWLPFDEVVAINRDAVERTGEPFALVSPDLLASALAKPQGRYHYGGEADAWRLGVVLLFAIARNHPFRQGNKRTGFIAAVIFLAVNGYRLDADDTEDLGEMVNQVLAGTLTEAGFEAALRPFVQAIDDA